MKKIVLLFCFFILLVVQPVFTATNVLEYYNLNPGFENNLTSWNLGGRTDKISVINRATVGEGDSYVFSGDTACKFTAITADTILLATNVFNVLPGEEYEFLGKYFLRSSAGEASAGNIYVYLQIEPIYANGYETTPYYIWIDLEDLNEWFDFETPEAYTVPEGVFHLKLSFVAFRSGDVLGYHLYLDDLEFFGEVSEDLTPPAQMSADSIAVTTGFGQATVEWYMNETDEDAYLYRVFYSNTPFTNIDNATLAGVVYVDEGITSLSFYLGNEGTNYFAVTCMDSAGNENKNVNTISNDVLNPGGLLTTDTHDWNFEGADSSLWTITFTGHSWGNTEQKKYGLKSLRYNNLTSSSIGRTVVSNWVDIDPLNEYTSSIWFYSASEAFTDAKIKCGIVWKLSDGSTVETTQSDEEAFTATERNKWELVSFPNVEPPADADSAQVKFYIWRSGIDASRTVYIDAARLVGSLIDTSPVININYPESNHDTYIQTVYIKGTTKYSINGQTIEIFSGGVLNSSVTLDADNGTWTGTAALSQSGNNFVVVKLNSSPPAYDTVVINYIAEPFVVISSPTNYHDTNITNIIVSGITLNTFQNDTVQIFVNGLLNSTFTLTEENGNWLGAANLTGSGDTVLVIVHSGGDTAANSIIVNYIPPLPTYNPIFPDSAYIQNFDGMSQNAQAMLPQGWRVDKIITVRTLGNWSTALTQTELAAGDNMSSSASNGIYNLSGSATIEGDKSIGWISSGSATKSGNLYTRFINESDSDLTGCTISFDVEKFRKGTNPAGYQIQMYYSTNGNDWTSAGNDFKVFFPADADTLGYTPAPGVTVSIVSKVLNVNVRIGNELYLAWNYSVETGTITTNAQCLAVDSVSVAGIAGYVSPYPEIKITAPLDLHDTITQTIIVSGTTYNSLSGDTIQIYTNTILNTTVVITEENGLWNGTAALTGRSDSIIVILSSSGEYAYDTITINYISGAPTVLINYPVSGGQRYDTFANEIVVSGTTINANDGDSIIILLGSDTQIIITVDSDVWSGTTVVPVSPQILTVRLIDYLGQTSEDTFLLTPGFIVSGVVQREGYAFDSGVLITLTNGIITDTFITTDTGYFYFHILDVDTYTISVNLSPYQSQTYEYYLNNALDFGLLAHLKAGDFTGDGKIGIKDAAAFKQFFGQLKSEYDIDGDGIVGEAEREFLRRNFE